VAPLQVAIRTTHWTIINHALIWGTLLLWLPFLAILSGLCGSVVGLAPLCGLNQDLLGSSSFWLAAVLGGPAAALLVDYTIMVFQRLVRPRASQLLQVGREAVYCCIVLLDVLCCCTAGCTVLLYCWMYCVAVLLDVLYCCTAGCTVLLYCWMFCTAVLLHVLCCCTAGCTVLLYCCMYCTSALLDAEH
jgi:hypothetical protein